MSLFDLHITQAVVRVGVGLMAAGRKLWLVAIVITLCASGSILPGQGIIGGGSRPYLDPRKPLPLSLPEAYGLALARVGPASNQFWCVRSSSSELDDQAVPCWSFTFANTNGQTATVRVRFTKEVRLDERSAEILAPDQSPYKIIAEAGSADHSKLEEAVQRLEAEAATHPTNLQATLSLAEAYRKLQQPQRVLHYLDQVLGSSQAAVSELLTVAKLCAGIEDYSRLEICLEKAVKLAPDSAEMWYDLAAARAELGKLQECMTALDTAVRLNAAQRRSGAPAPDLLAHAEQDERFARVRNKPEYKNLLNGR